MLYSVNSVILYIHQMHIVNNGLYNPHGLLYHYHVLIIHFYNLFLDDDEAFPTELLIHSNNNIIYN